MPSLQIVRAGGRMSRPWIWFMPPSCSSSAQLLEHRLQIAFGTQRSIMFCSGVCGYGSRVLAGYPEVRSTAPAKVARVTVMPTKCSRPPLRDVGLFPAWKAASSRRAAQRLWQGGMSPLRRREEQVVLVLVVLRPVLLQLFFDLLANESMLGVDEDLDAGLILCGATRRRLKTRQPGRYVRDGGRTSRPIADGHAIQ